MLPEWPVESADIVMFIAAPDVIDQKVKPALLPAHALKERLYLRVYCMVALNGNF